MKFNVKTPAGEKIQCSAIEGGSLLKFNGDHYAVIECAECRAKLPEGFDDEIVLEVSHDEKIIGYAFMQRNGAWAVVEAGGNIKTAVVYHMECEFKAIAKFLARR